MTPYFIKSISHTEFEVKIVLGDCNNDKWEKVIVLSAQELAKGSITMTRKELYKQHRRVR